MAKFGSCMSLETSLKSWPYPDMPGFPLNHEQDGLHYIGDAVAFWCARKKKWSLLCRTREEKTEWLIKQDWAEYRGPCPNIDEWEKSVGETQRLRSGLMKSVQYDNKCDQTGRSCREDEPCACQKEAETWLE